MPETGFTIAERKEGSPRHCPLTMWGSPRHCRLMTPRTRPEQAAPTWEDANARAQAIPGLFAPRRPAVNALNPEITHDHATRQADRRGNHTRARHNAQSGPRRRQHVLDTPRYKPARGDAKTRELRRNAPDTPDAHAPTAPFRSQHCVGHATNFRTRRIMRHAPLARHEGQPTRRRPIETAPEGKIDPDQDGFGERCAQVRKAFLCDSGDKQATSELKSLWETSIDNTYRIFVRNWP